MRSFVVPQLEADHDPLVDQPAASFVVAGGRREGQLEGPGQRRRGRRVPVCQPDRERVE